MSNPDQPEYTPMMNTYDGLPHEARPAPLTAEAYIAIGRIVRIAAEFEDAILLYVSRITGTKVHVLQTLLGQTPISRKIESARYLASIESDSEKAAFANAFGKEWDDFNSCRNAVAHGRYVGMVLDDDFAFSLPAKTLPTSPGKFRHKVQSYSVRALQFRADAAEIALTEVRRILGVESLHERLQTDRVVGPVHRKQKSTAEANQTSRKEPRK